MSGSNILQVTNLKDLKEIMESCVTVVMGFTTPKTPSDLKVFIRKFLKRKAEKFPFITFVYMEVSDSDRQSLNILRADHSMFPKIYHIRNGNIILVQVDAATEETVVNSFASAEQFYIDEMREIQKKIKEESSKKEVDSSDTEISIKASSDADDMSNKKINKTSQLQKELKQTPENKPDHKPEHTPEQTQLQTDPAVAKKINLEKLILLNKKADDLKIDLVKNITQRKKLENKLEKKIIEENRIQQEKQNKTLRRGGRRP
jgi:hypothetical protein